MSDNANILKTSNKNNSPQVTEKTILPYGFHDKIFEDAENEIKLNFKILDELKKLGFRLVRPSAIEFEESLDKSHSPDFFKLTDPVSGKMMVLRNDITPQIARIIRDKFAGQDFKKYPLNISYTGQVFSKNPKLVSTERQLTQTGFEYVDGNNSETDILAISNIINILKKVKYKNYVINFVFPKFLEVYLKDIAAQKSRNIFKAVEVKDYSILKKLDKTLYEIAIISDEINDFQTAEISLSKISKLIEGNAELVTQIKSFKAIITSLKKQFKDNQISFDILENSSFSYHSGLCYSVIDSNNYEEVGRGGRYTIQQSNKNINAVGFTFLVNQILRALKK